MENGASDNASIALRFNESINRRDSQGLSRLMTDDHVFIDTTGHAVRGKDQCVSSWQGFFEQVPDYQNVFERVTSRADLVLLVGYSTCSFPALAGPALWTARIRDGQVAEWRVYEDTPAQRDALAIP